MLAFAALFDGAVSGEETAMFGRRGRCRNGGICAGRLLPLRRGCVLARQKARL